MEPVVKLFCMIDSPLEWIYIRCPEQCFLASCMFIRHAFPKAAEAAPTGLGCMLVVCMRYNLLHSCRCEFIRQRKAYLIRQAFHKAAEAAPTGLGCIEVIFIFRKVIILLGCMLVIYMRYNLLHSCRGEFIRLWKALLYLECIPQKAAEAAPTGYGFGLRAKPALDA